ncbi:MAG: winged helix-turn-helix domain-containing protein [Candidatus Bathyarchaeia archaeon]
MIVESTASTNEFEDLALFFKLFSNIHRIRVLTLLENRSMSFGELMKELKVNPKVLSDALAILSGSELIIKSYPYQVYTLTPIGKIVVKEYFAKTQELIKRHLKRTHGSD